MKAKVLITVFFVISFYSAVVTALRKTPKVYNALITTDENLTSSRAYPVVQPTIHETRVPHLPYGPYHPYGFYPPLVRLGQAITPELLPSDQFAYPLFQPQITRHHSDVSSLNNPAILRNYPVPLVPHSNPKGEPHNSSDENINQLSHTREIPKSMASQDPIETAPPEQAPIPLNEQGLPPSLIPLEQFGNRNVKPINLPPYIYNHYPLIYNPASSFDGPYLPPYDYFPNNGFIIQPIPPKKNNAEIAESPVLPPMPVSATESKGEIAENVTSKSDVQHFENIKNGSANKNSEVPDVPPPAIPSGGKVTQP